MVNSSSLEVNGDLRLKLPVGFRFRPTDQELLVHYLARKVLTIPLPAPAVTDFDVFQTEPWALPGDLRERRHFFSRTSTRRNLNGTESKRVAAGSGYWRQTGKEKQIVAAPGNSNLPIGVRKTLVFHESRGLGDAKKQWIMQEFRLLGLPGATNPARSDNHTIPNSEEGDWAVYRVFQKRRKTRRHGRIIIPHTNNNTHVLCGIFNTTNINNTPTVIDISGPDPPPPTSPCSSSNTDRDGLALDDDEISSFQE